MAEYTQSPVEQSTPEQHKQEVEAKLDKASTSTWNECPPAAKEVSPLARFIHEDSALRTAILESSEIPPDESEPITQDQLIQLVNSVDSLIDEIFPPEAGLENPYHNSDHTRQVADRTASLIRVMQPPLSYNTAEATIIAAVYHDVEHPGEAKPEGHLNKSNEQRAANLADIQAEAMGLSLRQRVEVYTAIVGTSFWDTELTPHTQHEWTLKGADLGGYLESTEEWMEQSITVAEEYAQNARDGRPVPDFVKAWLYAENDEVAVFEWLAGQYGFSKYMLGPVNQELENYIEDSTTEWDGGDRLLDKIEIIEALANYYKTDEVVASQLLETNRITAMPTAMDRRKAERHAKPFLEHLPRVKKALQSFRDSVRIPSTE